MAKAANRHATVDWGTPDPHHADDYPLVLGTPVTQWAWELLRRREDYRRRYTQLLRDHGLTKIEDVEGGFTVRSWQSVEDALRAEFRVVRPSSGALRAQSTLNPRDGCPPLFEGAEIVVEVEVQPDPVRLPKVLIEFDAGLPIEPQLNGARRLLFERAKELPSTLSRKVKPPIDKFPRYLRLLDFQDAGAADKEIGRHLFPTAKGERLRTTIRDNLEQARKWQDDYLLLALHHPTHS